MIGFISALNVSWLMEQCVMWYCVHNIRNACRMSRITAPQTQQG